jgi:COP9 signalosome complex subunit 3
MNAVANFVAGFVVGNSPTVEKIISLITSDGNEKLDHLQSELSKCQEALAKSKEKHQFEQSLAILDPVLNTLGLIHLLQMIITQGGKLDKELFMTKVTEVIVQGSLEQIQVDPKRFASVCKKFVELCREAKQPMRAIKPMIVAIRKVGSPNHLTPQHTLLFQSCVSSKCYHAAVPVLDNFVYLVDEKVTGIKSEDTRLYYYYGGICYVALKKWKKAIQFFETVLSAPAIVASAIMIEAYKKYVLACLIYKGKVKALPNYINPAVIRAYKQFCAPYEDLATAFATKSFDLLCAAITQYFDAFEKDNHNGLVSQVRSAFIQQTILHLPDVYTTVTFDGLKDLLSLVNMSEIEDRVVKLAESAEFSVKIDVKKRYISFGHDGETYDNDETVNYLIKHIDNTIKIHRHIASVDRHIEKDEKYLQRQIKGETGRLDFGGPVRGGSDYGDMDMDVEHDQYDHGFNVSPFGQQFM